MSTVEGRFNQQPEDLILDEFHFACLSLQEDDTDEYSADTGLIEITKPVDGSGVTDAVSCVKEFCAKHNVHISVLTATFPDSWEKLTRDEIETLSLFTYNNILHRG